MKKFAWYLFCVILGAAIGLFAASKYIETRPISPSKPRVDTLYTRDTIVREKPVYITRRVVRVDTARLILRDTLRVCDSVLVSVPIEEKIYEDSLYRAVVSGFRPSLDSISIYQQTLIIERERERRLQPRLSFGVQAGLGVSFGASVQASPYLGVGVQYNLFNFLYDAR